MSGEPGSADAPAPARNGSRPLAPPALTRGWAIAIVRGAAAFVLMAAAGELLAFAGVAANGGLSSLANTLRVGGIYYALFHHIGIVFSVANVSVGVGSSLPKGLSFSYRVSLGLLLATGVAIALLYRAGRAVADRAGGDPMERAIHGVKVAVPYAFLSLLFSLLVAFHLRIPSNPLLSGDVTIKPSSIGAFVWPFLIASAAGLAGGIRSGREALLSQQRWGRSALGVLAGGWRMFLAGLVFSFAGLLVQAAVQPDATAAYFHGVFDQGPKRGALLIAHHVLLLPNQSMFVLVPAMGSPDRLSLLGSSSDLLSYWKFPESFSVAKPASQSGSPFGLPVPKLEGGIAPPGYFLYLLVPLLSALLGGRVAARRGAAKTRPQAIWLGLAAGVVFALLVGLGALVSGVGFGVSANVGLGISLSGGVAPSVTLGMLAALGWGLAFGAVGGVLEGRLLPAAPPPPPASVTSDFGFGPQDPQRGTVAE